MENKEETKVENPLNDFDGFDIKEEIKEGMLNIKYMCNAFFFLNCMAWVDKLEKAKTQEEVNEIIKGIKIYGESIKNSFPNKTKFDNCIKYIVNLCKKDK